MPKSIQYFKGDFLELMLKHLVKIFPLTISLFNQMFIHAAISAFSEANALNNKQELNKINIIYGFETSHNEPRQWTQLKLETANWS